MTARISQRELRNDSGAVMRRVAGGESLTVTRNGVPVADLVPHNQAASDKRPRFVPVDVVSAGLATVPDWGSASFIGELRELDGAVDDDDRDPWITG